MLRAHRPQPPFSIGDDDDRLLRRFRELAEGRAAGRAAKPPADPPAAAAPALPPDAPAQLVIPLDRLPEGIEIVVRMHRPYAAK